MVLSIKQPFFPIFKYEEKRKHEEDSFLPLHTDVSGIFVFLYDRSGRKKALLTRDI